MGMNPSSVCTDSLKSFLKKNMSFVVVVCKHSLHRWAKEDKYVPVELHREGENDVFKHNWNEADDRYSIQRLMRVCLWWKEPCRLKILANDKSWMKVWLMSLK